ncbi:biotin/lipoyl-containing protein, partial [Desulfuromonas sp. TF]|uniref:biotin/lipoyl-containing protein n=1 Tax=Desulfuromonas sp. TF TaxID=1232410 RepID=UPI0012DE9D56
MPTEITMPKLSDTMEEGTILKWRIKEGDKVAKGNIIAEVETDKATMEMEAFEVGVVTALKVDEGETVPVGTVIAILEAEGGKAGKAAEEEPAEKPVKAAEEE